MKNITKKLLAGALTLLLLAGCSATGNAPTTNPTQPAVGSEFDIAPIDGYTPINLNVSYYDNYQFNAYYNPNGAAEYLPDQGIYGSGNAYILRYNGMYYMYMGSSNMASSSLPCWQSEDLMRWTPVDNGINTPGTIAEDPRLYYTFPPCVKQYNGTFYMYLYIKNDVITQGNYILKASSPIGPFEFVTDSNGDPVCYTIEETTLNIDCDIFIDDDENVYFMSGHVDESFIGIRAFRMPTMDSVSYDDDSWVNIANSNIGGWTEGNGIFKRNGNYYLMYTGSDILKPGYLTHYATATGTAWIDAFGTEDRFNAPGFEAGLDWPMGCETQETFYALGHATAVLGPDMDGLYYHYFSVNGVGPNCSFAIDRLIFNGTGMDTAQTQYHSVAPRRPAIYSYEPLADSNFTVQTCKLLSSKASNAAFTAEFNFVGNQVKCVIGYTDDSNYTYVTVDLAAKEIGLYAVNGGAETKVATGKIVRDYDAENLLQTVRVAYRDGKADVYFDDLLKIENAAVQISAGKIGYLYEGDFEAGYTACSNVAKGLSDAIEPKQSYINIGAESYLPSGIFDGHGSVFTGSSGYGLVDGSQYGGSYAGLGQMTLSAIGDRATYLVDFAETGSYALQMTFNKKYAGKTVGIRVDGGEMMLVKLPDVAPNNGSDIVKAAICTLSVPEGVHEISIYGQGEEIAFHSFTFVKSYTAGYGFADTTEVTLPMNDSQRFMYWTGGDNLQDYTVECDFRLNGESDATAGFVLHGARYSDSQWVEENYWNMQGYYIALNKDFVRFEKLNYGYSHRNLLTENFDFEPDAWYHAKITVSGNTITVSITSPWGENLLFTFTDNLILEGGQFGLYTTGQSISYKNLNITVA